MQSTATATAPGLGGAGLQLRGLPTRHTLVLTDGLPLLGAEPEAVLACRPASHPVLRAEGIGSRHAGDALEVLSPAI